MQRPYSAAHTLLYVRICNSYLSIVNIGFYTFFQNLQKCNSYPFCINLFGVNIRSDDESELYIYIKAFSKCHTTKLWPCSIWKVKKYFNNSSFDERFAGVMTWLDLQKLHSTYNNNY